MDYIFIVLNFIHSVFIILNTIGYFKEGGMYIEHITQCKLLVFNNIQIKHFELPMNFPKWKKKERKRFISDNYHNFEICNYNESSIDMCLNMVKEKYDIPKFEKYEIRKIPDFMLDEPGEMMLYPDRNIFKLSNKGYIFKYPIGEFETVLINNSDKNVEKILSKENLTFYQIITQKKNEIIYVFELKEFTFEYMRHKNLKRRQRENEFGNRLFNLGHEISSTRNKYIE